MLINVLRDEAPSHVAVAFDLGRETFRLEEYAEYKAGRAKTPPEFHPQIDLIKDIVNAMGIRVVTKEGYEADDALATMARLGREAGASVEVMTGDKDSFQLATDTVTILYPKRGVSDLVRMTPEAIEEKYGVTPANYRGLATWWGRRPTTSPGVPGVGDKTAAKWLTAHGDLPGVLEHADEIGGKVGEKPRDHLGDVERNYRLNRLVDDVDLGLTYADLTWGEGDPAELSDLFDQLEFQALGKRLAAIFGDAATPAGAEVAPAREVEVTTVDVPTLLESIAEADVLALDSGRDVRTRSRRRPLPRRVHRTRHRPGRRPRGGERGRTHGAGEAARASALIFHSSKLQLKALRSVGIDIGDVAGDTALAAYLLVPDQRATSARHRRRTRRHRTRRRLGEGRPALPRPRHRRDRTHPRNQRGERSSRSMTCLRRRSTRRT